MFHLDVSFLCFISVSGHWDGSSFLVSCWSPVSVFGPSLWLLLLVLGSSVLVFGPSLWLQLLVSGSRVRCLVRLSGFRFRFQVPFFGNWSVSLASAFAVVPFSWVWCEVSCVWSVTVPCDADSLGRQCVYDASFITTWLISWVGSSGELLLGARNLPRAFLTSFSLEMQLVAGGNCSQIISVYRLEKLQPSPPGLTRGRRCDCNYQNLWWPYFFFFLKNVTATLGECGVERDWSAEGTVVVALLTIKCRSVLSLITSGNYQVIGECEVNPLQPRDLIINRYHRDCSRTLALLG